MTHNDDISDASTLQDSWEVEFLERRRRRKPARPGLAILNFVILTVIGSWNALLVVGIGRLTMFQGPNVMLVVFAIAIASVKVGQLLRRLVGSDWQLTAWLCVALLASILGSNKLIEWFLLGRVQ